MRGRLGWLSSRPIVERFPSGRLESYPFESSLLGGSAVFPGFRDERSGACLTQRWDGGRLPSADATPGMRAALPSRLSYSPTIRVRKNLFAYENSFRTLQ